MKRTLLLCFTLFATSGCATSNYALPKCDGDAKRPLNRSMWDWHAGKTQQERPQPSLTDRKDIASAFIEQSAEPAIKTAAFSGFDEPGSRGICGAG